MKKEIAAPRHIARSFHHPTKAILSSRPTPPALVTSSRAQFLHASGDHLPLSMEAREWSRVVAGSL